MTQIVGSRWQATPNRLRNSDPGMPQPIRGDRDPAARATQAGYVEIGLALAAMTGLVSISIVGAVGSLVFIVASLGLLVLRLPLIGPAILRFWPLLLLPGYAILSTLWSDNPPTTMRAGLELMITFMAGITFAKVFRVEQAINIFIIPFFAICLGSFPLIVLALAHKAPVTGLLGSKNALGFTAAMLMTLSVAIFANGDQKIWIRLLALGAIFAAVPIGYAARSVGADLNIALIVVLVTGFYVLRQLPPRARIVLTCIGLAAAGGALVISAQSPDISGRLIVAVGKDATLTGRTDLWRKAIDVGSQSPIVGNGYGAFWRIGNLDAEQMWRKFGILGRSGFNFHNTFVDMYVDLGALGVALLILTCVGIFAALLYRQIAQPSWSNDALMTIFISMIFRHVAETGLISPFSYYTVFLVFIAAYAAGAGIGLADGPPPFGQSLDRYKRRSWRVGQNLRW